MNSLNDRKISNAKAKKTTYSLNDGNGLYLFVTVRGRKVWRYRYKQNGKDILYTIGDYPDIDLKEARRIHAELRSKVANGIDLKEEKRRANFTLEEVAQGWLALKVKDWRPSNIRTQIARYNNGIKNQLGHYLIKDITRQDIAALIKPLNMADKQETARKILSILRGIFDHAVLSGLIETNPCLLVNKLIRPTPQKPMAAVTNLKDAQRLIQSIYEYKGSLITRYAMLFSALTFARPGEIRQAEWIEIDWQDRAWNIPAEKMKMGKAHFVPLARQTMAILKDLQPITGCSKYLFPSQLSLNRPMSDGTVRTALRRMGYTKEEMTAHGFRAMASTILNERGFNFDVIEAQLAHAGYDRIRAVYNRAQYREERRALMQAYADLLT